MCRSVRGYHRGNETSEPESLRTCMNYHSSTLKFLKYKAKTNQLGHDEDDNNNNNNNNNNNHNHNHNNNNNLWFTWLAHCTVGDYTSFSFQIDWNPWELLWRWCRQRAQQLRSESSPGPVSALSRRGLGNKCCGDWEIGRFPSFKYPMKMVDLQIAMIGC